MREGTFQANVLSLFRLFITKRNLSFKSVRSSVQNRGFIKKTIVFIQWAGQNLISWNEMS